MRSHNPLSAKLRVQMNGKTRAYKRVDIKFTAPCLVTYVGQQALLVFRCGSAALKLTQMSL